MLKLTFKTNSFVIVLYACIAFAGGYEDLLCPWNEDPLMFNIGNTNKDDVSAKDALESHGDSLINSCPLADDEVIETLASTS